MSCLNKPKEETWLYRYWDAIRRGEIMAGADMSTELDNLIADMDDERYRYDTRAADLKIMFIETGCKLTKSPYYGKPFLLLLWQKAYIEALFSFKMQTIDSGNDWIDRFVESLLLITRKGGKTELIGALGFSEMLLGKPGEDIVCSGTDDGTAALAFDVIDTMRVQFDPHNRDTWRNQKGLKCLATNSHIYRLSESTRQKEGRNIDFAGIDEVWSLEADNEIFTVIQQSTSTKDEYKIIMFGSEGFVDGGLLDQKREEYSKIIYGETDSDSSRRKLPWLYTQDDEREVWDTDESGISRAWEKSNPSIGHVKKWSYLKDKVEEARESRSKRAFVLAKDFNFKVSSASVWLSAEMLDTSKRFDVEDFRGALALGGVDLAETTDLCSAKVLLMRKGDKTKYILSMYWMPEGKLEANDDSEAGAQYTQWAKDGLIRIVEGNEVDTAVVADWFAELYREWGIRPYKIGFDQRFAKSFTNRMDEYGFDAEMVYQTRYVLSSPMRLVEADLRDGLINYNGNALDNWCLGNTSCKVYDSGLVMPIKAKGANGKRIDGTLSLIMSYEMLRRYRGDFMGALRG
jgi:phage terminase large subunit-like protein